VEIREIQTKLTEITSALDKYAAAIADQNTFIESHAPKKTLREVVSSLRGDALKTWNDENLFFGTADPARKAQVREAIDIAESLLRRLPDDLREREWWQTRFGH